MEACIELSWKTLRVTADSIPTAIQLAKHLSCDSPASTWQLPAIQLHLRSDGSFQPRKRALIGHTASELMSVRPYMLCMRTSNSKEEERLPTALRHHYRAMTDLEELKKDASPLQIR